MKWPRGRYNGMRILGISIKMKIDVTLWGFDIYWKHQKSIHIGCLHIWFGFYYGK